MCVNTMPGQYGIVLSWVSMLANPFWMVYAQVGQNNTLSSTHRP